MINFCYMKATTAAQGGYLLRPLTGDLFELHVGSNEDLASTLDPAVYPVGSILVDVYKKVIVFIDLVGKTVCILDDKEGTRAIVNNIVIINDENPQATKAQQILQDKQQERIDFDDKNSFV